jgi:uncharacterized BrkB/YihY/UPF0761 family membrane protein
VASSVLQIISFNNSHFRQTVISKAVQYFPVLGQHLENSIHDLKGTKIVLVISILFTLWGAKGIADMLQYAMNQIWRVPEPKRPGFVSRSLKSLGIIFLGGSGFIIAAFLSGFAANLNHGLSFRALSVLVSIAALFLMFWALFKWALASPREYSDRGVIRSALAASIGIAILQAAGGYLVKRQLGKLNSFYGSFGVTLALLFWIYLQAQIVIYSAVAGSLLDKKNPPRS